MIIYRSKVKDIIFEFLPPENRSQGVVILCAGLPSVPKQKDLMSYFSNKGFFVIYPRYRGTWESAGEFLEHSPTKDIKEITGLINQGEIEEFFNNKKFTITNKNICLIGSSFGGSVALSLIENPNISKIVALSPVVNLKTHNDNNNEQDLIWLGDFIKKAFGEAYRFKDANWEKMTKGEIFNPPQKISQKEAEKAMIFYDKEDPSIDFRKIEDYTSKNKIKSREIKNIGHLSFSKLNNDIKTDIIDHLQL